MGATADPTPIPGEVVALGDQPDPLAEDSAPRMMRIGEVAELTGTTPRTIRYYEEIGLLSDGTERELGKHRCYTEADVERIREIVKLKDLLGLSLEQLSQLLEAESARAGIRREFLETDDPQRRRELLIESQGHIDTQLRLVRGRIAELTKLEAELGDRAGKVREKLTQIEAELGKDAVPASEA